MFKKLKDKLAEEVKSSPHRIQQFAQAAQAAVTSASSSISDITNSDLFSIGDNDIQQNRSNKANVLPNNQTNAFQDVLLVQPSAAPTSGELVDHGQSYDIVENQRQRRMSNSSFASDVSFRLPSYESPSMYHLQSDMEISASEAEERGFSGSSVSLDRVTKEQIYAAYKRTQERYTKYRTQYADLARHYKLLERENAKARSVLVETQDKALRRISELREQCNLEQSAKAHLEKALRVEIEEKNIKIDTLNTKIQLLQDNVKDTPDSENVDKYISENEAPLINLSIDNDPKEKSEHIPSSEVTLMSNKIEKLEQLLNKYKESFKVSKEKNGQLTTDIQILSSELENERKENEQLKLMNIHLTEARRQVQELTDLNEELQNKINSYDFTKTREVSTLEIELQKAQEEIEHLSNKIGVFTKREEENAISLAENKLSIHKELDSKENEIKSLKDTVSANKKEIQSLNIVIGDYKNSNTSLEEEISKLNNDNNELNLTKARILDIELQLQGLAQKNQTLESSKTKADEDFKCLQLQLKQETAEKLAMIDRNRYLENKNTQLSEEITKKGSHVSNLDNELQILKKEKEFKNTHKETEKTQLLEEINVWKIKHSNLEAEIQEERDELVKLQSEIEKLLTNHEQIQTDNADLLEKLHLLQLEKNVLQEEILKTKKTISSCRYMLREVKELQQILSLTSQEVKSIKETNKHLMSEMSENINTLLYGLRSSGELGILESTCENIKKDYLSSQSELQALTEKYEKLSLELIALQSTNHNLETQVVIKQSENIQIKEKMQQVIKQHEIVLDEMQFLKNEKQSMMEEIVTNKNRYENLEASLKTVNDREVVIIQKVDTLEQENRVINENLRAVVDENEVLKTEIDKLKTESEAHVLKFNVLLNENNELVNKTNNMEYEKNHHIDQLKNNVKNLTQENILLKSQTEIISNSVKELESEISEVKRSHTKIELEKDQLSSVIEKLESQEAQSEVITRVNQDTQTDEYDPVINANNMSSETQFKDLDIAEIQQTVDVIEVKASISKDLAQENQSGEAININELAAKYQSLRDEYHSQKEENRRLQSDISGLQSYLAKISKENCVLNDKMRELFASSESSPDKSELYSRNLVELQSEIQICKDKIDDLIRENTLLIDENLELKDQVNSQNCKPFENAHHGDINIEMTNLQEKYNNLLDTKSKLERRLTDLEQMNNSVNRVNTQIQENNEKLHLSNEKLERRLDEALVSLRHLHSLQENTELEYLKNILYEYLTGSGIHSVTLAKVLAAVVKFDDKQTQQVLLKEKERQGLLRQLGLL